MEHVKVENVAKRLGVSYWTARAWIKQGRIKGFKIGPRWVVTEEALNEFIAQCQRRTTPGEQDERSGGGTA